MKATYSLTWPKNLRAFLNQYQNSKYLVDRSVKIERERERERESERERERERKRERYQIWHYNVNGSKRCTYLQNHCSDLCHHSHKYLPHTVSPSFNSISLLHGHHHHPPPQPPSPCSSSSLPEPHHSCNITVILITVTTIPVFFTLQHNIVS